MRRLAAVLICCFGCGLVWLSNAKAQGRGGTDWMTSNGDAQRSAWVRTDAKISPATMQQPGFKFLWKLKLNNQPRQLNSLAPPSTLERLIGYRGFRMLGFVGGSSDNILTIDTDLGRMEYWPVRSDPCRKGRAKKKPSDSARSATNWISRFR